MPTLRGLIDTLRTTRNVWSVVLLKALGGERKISLRGGFVATLSWPDYMTARDLVMQGYTLERSGDSVVCRRGDVDIAGTLHLLLPLAEKPGCLYDIDCRGKTVLDIGGCLGETAVDFARRGATKVVVYEPAPWNLEFLRRNCAVNRVNAEIHDEGIGPRNEIVTVSYDRPHAGVGLASTGAFQAPFKIRDLADVIGTSGADVAKFDCEGGEQALLGVPGATLRMIEVYVIEAHGRELRDALVEKFQASGFETPKSRLLHKAGRPEQEPWILAFRRLGPPHAPWGPVAA
ncbi:MAG TPA: FkbM family methyltransferase [bacterium]|nr:FkbM family methyltransferase [bacterium]